ncbi:deoxyribonuclease-2-beta [Mesocricetus auratus]|uniref:Deoxyribonuclease-2-beta n=1 Tax=Mesocricetus auratus TaxID=10036 RepID=A0ABM2Y227_MESAU|nr:deoxyribonuclease-2-beta [Mesocricetus auratus]
MVQGNRWKMAANPLRTALALLFFALSGVLGTGKISCINEEGEAVDWFVFYKLPKKVGEDIGLQYMFLDSTMASWRKSRQLVSSKESILGRTLAQLYEAYASKRNDTAYLIYNDGIPESQNYNRKYGHTKGLLVWNRVQGFWLIHSVPGFSPVPEDGFIYPSSGRKNGQSGICITFKYSQFKAIDSQLLIYQPNIRSCSIPNTFHRELIHMPQLCAKSSSSKIHGRQLTKLQSAQGLNFLHFAKSSSYSDDIFAAWMAQHLKTHLLANTWQWKAYALPSNCSLPYHVYNIKKLKTPDQFYFPSSSDHSKWCVSTKNSRHQWVCIGDLNRSKYQVFRSGGFICTKNRYIYQSFYRLVVSYEPCD